MNICCRDHAIWRTKRSTDDVQCITEVQDIHDLLRPAPLQMAYRSYCCYHSKHLLLYNFYIHILKTVDSSCVVLLGLISAAESNPYICVYIYTVIYVFYNIYTFLCVLCVRKESSIQACVVCICVVLSG